MGCTPSEPAASAEHGERWPACTCRRSLLDRSEEPPEVAVDTSESVPPSAAAPSRARFSSRESRARYSSKGSASRYSSKASGSGAEEQQILEQLPTSESLSAPSIAELAEHLAEQLADPSMARFGNSSQDSPTGPASPQSTQYSPASRQHADNVCMSTYGESSAPPSARSHVDSISVCSDYQQSPTTPLRRNRRRSITEKTAVVASACLQCIVENPGIVTETYTLEKEVGHGTSGSVCSALVKVSGAHRAVKTIPKEAISKESAMVHEIKIMKTVDQLHVVKLYETFEDSSHLFLVMPFSAHGTLGSRVASQSCMNETETKQSMRQLVSAINYLHRKFIIHRDVKPENVLIHSVAPLNLKLTDFGISRFFKPNQVFTSEVGSPQFMAPEVFRKSYNEVCDIWSCGITMYYMLCGYLPFAGCGSYKEIKSAVLRKKIQFGTVEWVDIAPNTLGFLELLLKKNPRARYTAEQAFHHEWLRVAAKGMPLELTQQIITQLRRFRKENKLKRSSLVVIASMLKSEACTQSHKVFDAIDTDGDGEISVAELQKILKSKKARQRKVPLKMSDNEVVEMFEENADWENDLSDKVCKPFTYTEFCAATFDRKRWITKALGKAAFNLFDKDGDGRVSMAELACGQLLGHLSMEELAETLEALDANGDGFLDFQEFQAMLLQ